MSAPDKYLVWVEEYPEDGGFVFDAHSTVEAKQLYATHTGDDLEALSARRLKRHEWLEWRRFERAEAES